MRGCRPIGVAIVIGAFGLAYPAAGGFVDIGGGWRAQWDDTLDDFVSIEALGVEDGAVFIRKSAEFTQGSEGGVFPSIPIVFRQIEFNAAEYIVIEDEIITNSTGETWFDFHFQLVDSGDAVFDPELTMNSGGGGPIGFDIDPFTEASFSEDLERLDIDGGQILDGEIWTPGAGASGGQLWIDVTPAGEGEDFTVFTLKETPTPAPGVVALLALGGLLGRRRRAQA